MHRETLFLYFIQEIRNSVYIFTQTIIASKKKSYVTMRLCSYLKYFLTQFFHCTISLIVIFTSTPKSPYIITASITFIRVPATYIGENVLILVNHQNDGSIHVICHLTDRRSFVSCPLFTIREPPIKRFWRGNYHLG